MTPDLPEQKAKPAASGILQLEFGQDTAFQMELRRRVDEFFQSTGRRKRDCWQMYLKTALILAFFIASYLLLVFFAHTLWQGLAYSLLLGFATAGIGFNIQHDGGHGSYSERRWVNRLMAATLDLIGGSSYIWHWKHTVIHHRYTNITGFDPDIDIGSLARLSPFHLRRWYFRWQHLYLWPLYCLESIKLQVFNDFRDVIQARIGHHSIPRPRGWELLGFVAGKCIFLTLALVIPLLVRPWPAVLLFFLLTSACTGIVLVLVFVLPHSSGDADFPLPQPQTGRIQNPWAIHQVLVTLDFSRRSPILTWFLGGLNFHKEHHLLPLICHIHYPALSTIVQQTCRDFGLPYKDHGSALHGVISHYHWLKQMGAVSPAARLPQPPS